MNTTDIKSYMQPIGQEARAASRLVAKADMAAKNRALTAMSAWIRTINEQDGFRQVVL